jgi:hypothetical protein
MATAPRRVTDVVRKQYSSCDADRPIARTDLAKHL